MKNLKVWLVFLPMFTIACSDEYTGETTTEQAKESAKKTASSPANPANPYDLAGSSHNEILDKLEEIDFDSQSIADVANAVDSVSVLCPGFELVTDNPPLSARLVEITSIANSNNALEEVLASSNLGTAAKSSLSTFVGSLLLSADDPYEAIHAMIISYEAGVLANAGFSSEDRQIILTTTSVARFSASRKKRKDKDWETSVTSIAAAISGAQECPALALKMGVTAGLCQNDNVMQ